MSHPPPTHTEPPARACPRPAACLCCRRMDALLHALTGPCCALQAVADHAPPKAPGDPGLFTDALNRLLAIWHRGRQQQHPGEP